jgi:thiol:disulfide interchange protein DsbC
MLEVLMRRIIVFAAAVLFFLPSLYAYGFSTKGTDCSKCHTLKKDEAAGLLKKVVPNVRVLGIRTIPLKAMWEVDMEANGQKGLVYVYFSKKHLIFGSIIDTDSVKNLTEERLIEISKVDRSKIPLKDAILMGDSKAKQKIIVFTDPD